MISSVHGKECRPSARKGGLSGGVSRLEEQRSASGARSCVSERRRCRESV